MPVGFEVEYAFRIEPHVDGLLRALAEEVIGNDQIAAIVLVEAVAVAAPDDIVVDHDRQIRGFQKDAAPTRRVGSNDDVLGDACVGVAVIDP